MTITEDRYRMLLGASSALADQPTVKAVLQSLRGVLSSTSRLHGAELYVLSDDGESLSSFEFDRDPDAPAIKRGAKLLLTGLVAQVLDEQKPVFVPDLSRSCWNTLTWLLLQPKLPDEAPICSQYRPRKNGTEFCQRQSCRASNLLPKTSRCSVPWLPTLRSRSSAHWQEIPWSVTTVRS